MTDDISSAAASGQNKVENIQFVREKFLNEEPAPVSTQQAPAFSTRQASRFVPSQIASMKAHSITGGTISQIR